MSMKALPLIFLVVFGAFATSVVLYLSSIQIIEGNFGFAESYNIVQANDKVGIAPNGEPINTPGMPG